MLRSTSMVPVFEGKYDSDGKPLVKMLAFGTELEADPERAGYARWKHVKGSMCRSGKGYFALGLPAAISPVAIPAQVGIVPGTTGELEWDDAIREPGWLGYHIIQGVPAAPSIAMPDMRYRNDGLLSGNVPCSMFIAESFYNPFLGHFISERTSLTTTYLNFTLGIITILPGFILVG